jgi:chromosome segregation ATPase
MVTVALLALAGCGGDEEEKARQYIDSAREEAKSIAQKQLEIQRRGEELNKYLEESSSITLGTVAATEELLKKLTELADVTSEAAAAARAGYEKVLELEGVEEYREYAENRIEALELVERRSELAVQFASVYSKALATGLETGQIDEAALRGQVEPLVAERDSINEEIEDLNGQAADLEEQLDL